MRDETVFPRTRFAVILIKYNQYLFPLSTLSSVFQLYPLNRFLQKLPFEDPIQKDFFSMPIESSVQTATGACVHSIVLALTRVSAIRVRCHCRSHCIRIT